MFVYLQAAYREQIKEKAKDGGLKAVNGSAPAPEKKKRRWDMASDTDSTVSAAKQAKTSSWDAAEAATPGQVGIFPVIFAE